MDIYSPLGRIPKIVDNLVWGLAKVGIGTLQREKGLFAANKKSVRIAVVEHNSIFKLAYCINYLLKKC
jgi:hypothetical protein